MIIHPYLEETSYNCAIRDALAIVKGGADSHFNIGGFREYKSRWIPCSERLPSKEERFKSYCRNIYGAEYIVMIEGATLPTTLYIGMTTNVWFDDEHNRYRVIAWQPLPEPYKEGE